jgi:Secretion system C-terminal sorting domain
MKNIYGFIYLLTVTMSIIFMASIGQAQVTQRSSTDRTPLQRMNNAPSVPVWPYKVFSDSCNFKTYQEDDNTVDAGWSASRDSLIRMGNYFPLDSVTTGIIQSVDMYFSSNQYTTAQSCIIYFYKADQTTILGQSASFINTGATWPDGTWVNVLCADIPYTGSFYAMVDYKTDSVFHKNFFDSDCFEDVGYVDRDGVWSLAESFFGVYCYISFLQRINVCEYGPDGIKEKTLSSVSVYPNPANKDINIVSAEDINKIEVLNFLGQSIYMTSNINLKSKEIDVTGFNAGQYLVKVVTRGGMEMKKISVIH